MSAYIKGRADLLVRILHLKAWLLPCFGFMCCSGWRSVRHLQLSNRCVHPVLHWHLWSHHIVCMFFVFCCCLCFVFSMHTWNKKMKKSRTLTLAITISKTMKPNARSNNTRFKTIKTQHGKERLARETEPCFVLRWARYGLAGGSYFRSLAIRDALSPENLRRIDWNVILKRVGNSKKSDTPWSSVKNKNHWPKGGQKTRGNQIYTYCRYLKSFNCFQIHFLL